MARSAACGDAIRLGHDRAAGHHGDAGEPGTRDAFDRARTDGWQVDPMVLAGLGRLHQHAAALAGADTAFAAQFGDARQHLVGALGAFDRQHPVVGHHDRLPDIERTGRAQQIERTCDVSTVCDAWFQPTERSFRHQYLRRDLVGTEHTEALLLEQLCDAAQQMVVAAAEDTRRFAAASATS